MSVLRSPYGLVRRLINRGTFSVMRRTPRFGTPGLVSSANSSRSEQFMLVQHIVEHKSMLDLAGVFPSSLSLLPSTHLPRLVKVLYLGELVQVRMVAGGC